MSLVAGHERGGISPVRPIKDAEGNVVTQDTYDDLVDEYDEARAKVLHLEDELAELRRRFALVEALPVAGHVEVSARDGDIIRRPVLMRRMVLAALHGDIEEVPTDG